MLNLEDTTNFGGYADRPVATKFKYEVQTDATGEWYGNAVTFDTKKEAEDGARDLMSRWLLVLDWRVVEVD